MRGGCPNERVDLDGRDDQANNGRPETRSTKVPTKSGLGFSVEAVNKDVSSGDDVSFAGGDAGQAPAWTTSSMTRRWSGPHDTPDWSSGGGKKTVPELFVGRHPQEIPGYAGGAAGFLLGGAMSTGGSVSARRPTGGLQRPSASMALSDKLYREESKKCKEAGGAQENLSNEEDNNDDIVEEEVDDQEDKAGNAEVISASAEERTQ
jgi:hypothetical protein